MSYLSLGRAYLQFDWADPYHGFRIAFGIWPKSGLLAEESRPVRRYGQDVTAADVGSYGGTDPDEDDLRDRLRAVMQPHPFQDPDALQGHITAPAGAQSFEPVARDATRIPNPPSRDEE